MKLFSLLAELGVAPTVPDAEITGITDSLASVSPGTLFVSLHGGREVEAALAGGAAAVVCEEDFPFDGVIRVPASRTAFSRLCAAYFGHPDRRLRLIGITGTNGKTTTARYIKHILESAGHRCAVIGTLGADVGAGEQPTGYTTPDAAVFFRALADAVKNRFEYCVCEVSSQALAQSRVDGAGFHLGIFTNIGSDHLDYHKTVGKLVEAKTRLCGLSERMLLNADDAYCEQFAEAAKGKKIWFYSCRAVLSDYAAKNIRQDPEAVRYILFNGSAVKRVSVPAIGMFSVYNSLCAAAAAMIEGVPLEEAAESLGTLPQIPGRAQMIEKQGIRFCVDYAHTPDALSEILTALRPGTGGRLITVFGCGGDRDQAKRPVMGEIAARLSDEVILTSDNPRGEDPLKIIADIKSKLHGKNAVFCEPDRRKAIALAYTKASPGDTVLVAGKGHETYQLAGEEKLPFSDTEEIESL